MTTTTTETTPTTSTTSTRRGDRASTLPPPAPAAEPAAEQPSYLSRSTRSLTPRYGLVRLYDRQARLLTVAYSSEAAAVSHTDQSLLLSHGAVLTFTPTPTLQAAQELAADLAPLFRAGRHYLTQPGGYDYLHASERALLLPSGRERLASGTYVEPCPTCPAPAHAACSDYAGQWREDEPHPARVALAAQLAAARVAAFAADPGRVVWAGQGRAPSWARRA